jgi:hypothetical protein
MIGCSTSSGLLSPILAFENCGEMYIFECGVPNVFLCFRAGSNKWSCDSESDLDEGVGGKGREFPNAVSARHEDSSSCQRLSLLETTLPASGCSPFIKTRIRLCSGAL